MHLPDPDAANVSSAAKQQHVSSCQHSLSFDADVQGMSEGAQLHGGADSHWQQKEGRAGGVHCWGIHSLHLSGAREQAHHPLQPWQCSGPGADAALLPVMPHACQPQASVHVVRVITADA